MYKTYYNFLNKKTIIFFFFEISEYFIFVILIINNLESLKTKLVNKRFMAIKQSRIL